MTDTFRNSTIQRLANRLIEYAPGVAATDIESAPAKEAVKFLVDLPEYQAAALIAKITPVKAQQLMEKLPLDSATAILSALDPPRAAAIVARLKLKKRNELLEGLDKKNAGEIRSLSQFPGDTAGSMMDPEVMAFHPNMKAGGVLKQLRKLPNKDARNIFLVDEEGVLCGSVPLQTLAVADPGQLLEELKGPSPLAVLGVASSNEVMDALSGADTTSVVVVDINNHLLGVIRRDNLVQAALETASVDVQAMVGAGKEERALSSPLFVVRKRLPWLIVNLATAFLAAAVVGVFESTIAKFTALAVLLPVVAGQSGNTGAQALAVTMRGLALREVRVSQALLVCFKELRAGFLNGLAVALITAGAVYLWSRSLGLSLVIILSMIVSMTAAGFSGAVIPMLLTVLRQDPAQSSSIVLTTVTDVVGFLSFLGIATLLSSML